MALKIFKQIFNFKSVTIRAVWISVVISALISSISLLINSSLTKEANTLSKEANKTAEKSFDIADKIYKSKDIPRLITFPVSAEFYTPDKPEVPGQVKINISAIIENLSEVSAREISINFETEDWYGHKTNLFDIYKETNLPIPHFLSLPKNSRLLYPSYAPDAPASGESGFVAQDKPFKLKLILYWKDINDEKYVYVGFYDLKSTRLPNDENRLYFQPIDTYDNIKDGDIAWNNAKKQF